MAMIRGDYLQQQTSCGDHARVVFGRGRCLVRYLRMQVPNLARAAQGRRNTRRIAAERATLATLIQLFVGLVAFGMSLALLVQSNLGLDPWDVLHQGLSITSGIPIGVVTVITGAIVLALWFPLRQRPGIGTVANVIVVGVTLDAVLSVLPAPTAMLGRWSFLLAGILLNGLATGAYIGAGLGAGPRDGLMMALAARGYSVRIARTTIEVSVLAAGYFLGGTVGIGTLLYAATIGPIVHITLPTFSRRGHRT